MKAKYNGRVFYMNYKSVLRGLGFFWAVTHPRIVCVDSALCSELHKDITRKEQELKALESYLTQLYYAYCEALGDILPYDEMILNQKENE